MEAAGDFVDRVASAVASPVVIDHSASVLTSSRNVVSRQADLACPERIVVSGCSIICKGAVIRADRAAVSIGQYCRIGEGAKVQPATAPSADPSDRKYLPCAILDNVIIERNATVQATMVDCNTHIMEGAIVGERCVIGPCCRVLPGAVVPPDTVVAPGTVVGGRPATIVDFLPSGFAIDWARHCRDDHRRTVASRHESLQPTAQSGLLI